MSIGPVGPSKSTGSVYKKADLTKMSKKDLIRVIHKQLAFLKHRSYISSLTAEHLVDDKKLGSLSHEELEKKAATLQKDLILETIRGEYKPAINRYRVEQKMADAEVSLILDEISKKNKEIQDKWEEVQKEENCWLEENCKKMFNRDFKSLLEEYGEIGDSSSFVSLVRAAYATGRKNELSDELGRLIEEHEKKFGEKYRQYQKEENDFVGPKLARRNQLFLRKRNARLEVEAAIRKILELEDYSGEPVDAKIKEEGDIILSSPTLGIEELHSKGIDGRGVTIAIVDKGIYPHPEYKDRLIAYEDFVGFKDKPRDEVIHGTYIAGIAAGEGKISNGRYEGAAPAANIVGLNAGDKNGMTIEAIYKAITWILENKDKYQIKVVNFSWGGLGEIDKYEKSMIDELVESGITVVAAVANSGPESNAIGYPAAYKNVIAVGNLDQSFTKSTMDDDINAQSGRGRTVEGNVKPDIVAPGTSIVFTMDKEVIIDSGTSASAPLVSGVVALMLQVNSDLTPEQIGNILRETADKLPGISKEAQGSGVINPRKAVEAARRLKKSSH